MPSQEVQALLAVGLLLLLALAAVFFLRVLGGGIAMAFPGEERATQEPTTELRPARTSGRACSNASGQQSPTCSTGSSQSSSSVRSQQRSQLLRAGQAGADVSAWTSTAAGIELPASAHGRPSPRAGRYR